MPLDLVFLTLDVVVWTFAIYCSGGEKSWLFFLMIIRAADIPHPFRRVVFPELFPAWLSGVALAFARAVGEYGSVIFVTGNIPGKSKIAPVQIMSKLEDFRYSEATAASSARASR